MTVRRKPRVAFASVIAAALLATMIPLTPALAAPEPRTQQRSLAVDTVFPSARSSLNRDPSKIGVFVNKSYPLKPIKYIPKTTTVKGTGIKLQPAAATAYDKMLKAASKDGVKIRLVSGYRSYTRQAELHNYYTEIYGSSYAQRIAAKPGTSEHQTGLALDVGNTNKECGLQACFASTAVGKWVAKNGQKYGFILRYPKGQESVTGYAYEPWHFRYVGTSLAKSYKNSGATSLENYYGVTKKKKTTTKKVKGAATTTENLNLRSGAGTETKILLMVPKGTSVKLTGSKKSSWYQVTYKSQTGWVSGTYLSNISMPKPSTPEKTPTKNTNTKKTTASLNMRSGNGSKHKIILTIPKGRSVAITGSKKSDWYPVTYKSKNGWVSGAYLK